MNDYELDRVSYLRRHRLPEEVRLAKTSLSVKESIAAANSAILEPLSAFARRLLWLPWREDV